MRQPPRQSFVPGKLLFRGRDAKTVTSTSWVEEGGSCTRSRWALVELFRQQVEDLQEKLAGYVMSERVNKNQMEH